MSETQTDAEHWANVANDRLGRIFKLEDQIRELQQVIDRVRAEARIADERGFHYVSSSAVLYATQQP